MVGFRRMFGWMAVQTQIRSVMTQLKRSRKVPRPVGPGTYEGSVRGFVLSELGLASGAAPTKELNRKGMSVLIRMLRLSLRPTSWVVSYTIYMGIIRWTGLGKSMAPVGIATHDRW